MTRSSAHDQLCALSGRVNSIIYSVSLATAEGGRSGSVLTRKPKELLRIGKTREAAGLQISPDGKWLVVISNRKVHVARMDQIRDGFTKYVSDQRLTCLAFHPTESYFATGDAEGKIRLWYCLDNAFMAQQAETRGDGTEKRAPTSTMHWHAHAVGSIAFSPNGAYLLSGGEEAVLVLWQLASGQKEFVPRLGAPIASVAVANGLDGREQEYAVGLMDGSMVFVGAMNLKPLRTFSRVKIGKWSVKRLAPSVSCNALTSSFRCSQRFLAFPLFPVASCDPAFPTCRAARHRLSGHGGRTSFELAILRRCVRLSRAGSRSGTFKPCLTT